MTVPLLQPTDPIRMRHVASTNLVRAGYSAERKALRVRFSDGKTYEYHDVTPELADAFWKAPSKGTFVARTLRDQFPTFQLSTWHLCIRCTSAHDHPAAYYVEMRRNDTGGTVGRGILCTVHADEVWSRPIRPELTQYFIPLAEVADDVSELV